MRLTQFIVEFKGGLGLANTLRKIVSDRIDTKERWLSVECHDGVFDVECHEAVQVCLLVIVRPLAPLCGDFGFEVTQCHW